MRSKIAKAVVGISLAATMLVVLNPASAASAYHMNGQGTIAIGGGGLPSCAGVAPNCTSPDNTFSWGELTVQGVGLLANQTVAGTYTCRSEGTIGTAFESRIYGNTSNFALTFNFQCTRDSGSVGPAFINGWFSNVTSEPVSNPAYRSSTGHPHPGITRGGAPFFKGFFRADNTHPYSISATNGEAMTCGGGFAPNNYNFANNTIPTAAFMGACTAGDS